MVPGKGFGKVLALEKNQAIRLALETSGVKI